VSAPALLLDENLSPRLTGALKADFPGTAHVDTIGLRGRPDRDVWLHACEHNMVIVSKDNDFRQMSFLHGAPPKVVWLRIGNASTQSVLSLLLQRKERIISFCADEQAALLVLSP